MPPLDIRWIRPCITVSELFEIIIPGCIVIHQLYLHFIKYKKIGTLEEERNLKSKNIQNNPSSKAQKLKGETSKIVKDHIMENLVKETTNHSWSH